MNGAFACASQQKGPIRGEAAGGRWNRRCSARVSSGGGRSRHTHPRAHHQVGRFAALCLAPGQTALELGTAPRALAATRAQPRVGDSSVAKSSPAIQDSQNVACVLSGRHCWPGPRCAHSSRATRTPGSAHTATSCQSAPDRGAQLHTSRSLLSRRARPSSTGQCASRGPRRTRCRPCAPRQCSCRQGRLCLH